MARWMLDALRRAMEGVTVSEVSRVAVICQCQHCTFMETVRGGIRGSKESSHWKSRRQQLLSRRVCMLAVRVLALLLFARCARFRRCCSGRRMTHLGPGGWPFLWRLWSWWFAVLPSLRNAWRMLGLKARGFPKDLVLTFHL